MATYRQLSSGLWQARVWHPGLKKQVPAGKPHPIKKRVQEQAAEAERQIRRGEWIEPRRGAIRLDEWWDIFSGMRTLENASRRRDLSIWRNHVQPAFGSWSLNALVDGSEDIAVWVTEMGERGVGGETVKQALRILKQLMEAARLHKRITRNPCSDITAPTPPPHEDRVLSRREQKIVRLMFTGTDRLIVETFLGTGIRWEELAGLRVFRFDQRRQVLKIREVLEPDGTLKEFAKSTAGNRTVPVTRWLTRRLARHVAGKAPGDFIFTAPGGAHGRKRGEGGRLYYANWRVRVWEPAIRRARLADPQPTIHDLRHTWCSDMANSGMPLPELREISGHGTVTALQRYLHGSDKTLDKARSLMERRHGVGTPALIPVPGGRQTGRPRTQKAQPDVRKRETG